ncbi:MAG TPA: hypothetical protein PKC27_06820 [Methanomethylovorans sp.]|nr:hypothetical protein [Methanomethylovorans sp.]
MKINVIFYSLYGHIYRMAEVELFQIQETFNEEMLEKMGPLSQRNHLPIYR